jgi:hypothetical protein
MMSVTFMPHKATLTHSGTVLLQDLFERMCNGLQITWNGLNPAAITTSESSFEPRHDALPELGLSSTSSTQIVMVQGADVDTCSSSSVNKSSPPTAATTASSSLSTICGAVHSPQLPTCSSSSSSSGSKVVSEVKYYPPPPRVPKEKMVAPPTPSLWSSVCQGVALVAGNAAELAAEAASNMGQAFTSMMSGEEVESTAVTTRSATVSTTASTSGRAGAPVQLTPSLKRALDDLRKSTLTNSSTTSPSSSSYGGELRSTYHSSTYGSGHSGSIGTKKPQLVSVACGNVPMTRSSSPVLGLIESSSSSSSDTAGSHDSSMTKLRVDCNGFDFPPLVTGPDSPHPPAPGFVARRSSSTDSSSISSSDGSAVMQSSNVGSSLMQSFANGSAGTAASWGGDGGGRGSVQSMGVSLWSWLGLSTDNINSGATTALPGGVGPAKKVYGRGCPIPAMVADGVVLAV